MQHADPPLVSVVVVARDRRELLASCLRSLREQTEARFEVLVVLNGATAAVAQLARSVADSDARVRPLPCSPRSASMARNLGVQHAGSELLVFLDDDVRVPPDYLGTVIRVLEEHSEVSIAGGPNLTPPEASSFARICGELLASPLGSGVTRRRYGAAAAREATERDLILCNLVVRRRVFTEGIEFPYLFGGEENVLMGRARHASHRLWYSPELWVYHHRRETLRGYLAQVYRYGWGRGIALRSAPGTFHPTFLLPPAFVGYLGVLPWLARGSRWLVAPAGVYLGLAAASALPVAARAGRLSWAPLIPGLFLLTHGAYAAGLASELLRRRRSVDVAPIPAGAVGGRAPRTSTSAADGR